MDQRTQAEGAKDQVGLPLDVLEGGRGEEGETEVAAQLKEVASETALERM